MSARDGRERPATEPSKCRSCGQDILWCVWPRSGKRMPVDAVADNRPPSKGGDIWLTLHGGERGELRAEKVDPGAAPEVLATRNRYTSHFATCPNAAMHRKAGGG